MIKLPYFMLSLALLSACSTMPNRIITVSAMGETRADVESKLPARCRHDVLPSVASVSGAFSTLGQTEKYTFPDGQWIEVTYLTPGFISKESLLHSDKPWPASPADQVTNISMPRCLRGDIGLGNYRSIVVGSALDNIDGYGLNGRVVRIVDRRSSQSSRKPAFSILGTAEIQSNGSFRVIIPGKYLTNDIAVQVKGRDSEWHNIGGNISIAPYALKAGPA